jgi:selenocysteine lyase/cysteine desulfurase
MTTWQPDVSRVALGDRRLFPDLSARAYLSHAAISPASSEVQRACAALVADYAKNGLGAFQAWRDQRERLRARLARLIGAASASDVAFVANTTRSVIDVALSLPWRPKDVVLCLRGEFPANVTPWQQAARTFELELRFLEVEAFRTDEGLAALERELARGVRLVAVSAVQFQTGLRMPIEAIAERAHAIGAEVFVDAIQACGVVPIDVARAGIDYLGCGSHKWLMGLEGAAFVYARPDRAAALVRAWRAGSVTRTRSTSCSAAKVTFATTGPSGARSACWRAARTTAWGSRPWRRESRPSRRSECRASSSTCSATSTRWRRRSSSAPS